MAEVVIFKGKGEKKTTVNSFKLEDADANELNEFLSGLPHPPQSLRDAILLLKSMAEDNFKGDAAPLTADERIELQRYRDAANVQAEGSLKTISFEPTEEYTKAHELFIADNPDWGEGYKDPHLEFFLYLIRELSGMAGAILKGTAELNNIKETAQKRWLTIQAKDKEIAQLKASTAKGGLQLKDNEAVIEFTKEQIGLLAKARRILQVSGHEFKTEEPAEVLHAAVEEYLGYVGEMSTLAKQFTKFEGIV